MITLSMCSHLGIAQSSQTSQLKSLPGLKTKTQLRNSAPSKSRTETRNLKSTKDQAPMVKKFAHILNLPAVNRLLPKEEMKWTRLLLVWWAPRTKTWWLRECRFSLQRLLSMLTVKTHASDAFCLDTKVWVRTEMSWWPMIVYSRPQVMNKTVVKMHTMQLKFKTQMLSLNEMMMSWRLNFSQFKWIKRQVTSMQGTF